MKVIFALLLLLPTAIILYLTRPRPEAPVEETFFDGDEELGWYDWEEEYSCEICDEVIYSGEALVYIKTEEELTLFCEYCLNPAL